MSLLLLFDEGPQTSIEFKQDFGKIVGITRTAGEISTTGILKAALAGFFTQLSE